MTFPTVRSSSSGTINSNSTTHTITMPPTIESGDLLLCFYVQDNGVTDTWDDTTLGTWTVLYESTQQIIWSTARALIADGTEDSQTISFTGANEQHSYAVYAIKDWFGTISTGVEESNANSSSTTPDPPSLTASWGADDNLWFAAAHIDRRFGIDTAPTNYTDLVFLTSATIHRATLATARREFSSSDTQDPGVFSTMSASDGWIGGTVVIRPEGVSVDLVPPPNLHSFAVTRAASY